MSGSPMDPERLAELRIKVAGMVAYCSAQTEGGTGQWSPVADLLADRDHWESETDAALDVVESLRYDLVAADVKAQRYRSRCPVTAEDVRDASVTKGQAVAWARANRVYPARAAQHPVEVYIAAVANSDRSAFDILDEMAALAPETDR